MGMSKKNPPYFFLFRRSRFFVPNNLFAFNLFGTLIPNHPLKNLCNSFLFYRFRTLAKKMGDSIGITNQKIFLRWI